MKTETIKELVELAIAQPEHKDAIVEHLSRGAQINDAQADCLKAHAGEAGACIGGVFYAEP